MDNAKDIILALLSGSVSLAGLLLIFSGFLFSQAAGFDPDHTPDKMIDAYRNAARVGVLPFLMCLAERRSLVGAFAIICKAIHGQSRSASAKLLVSRL